MTLRLGIVGLGVISRYYLAGLEGTTGLALVAVCDLVEENLRPFRNRARCFVDYRDMLECCEHDLDAVIVNVPNDQHFRICSDALLAGYHVCCEKPLTIKLSDAEEIVELSKRTDRQLFTAFHRRYNVNVRKALSRPGNSASVSRIVASYDERIQDHVGNDDWYMNPRRCGGGCVADNGPNVFDTVTYFFGRLEVNSADIVTTPSGMDTQARIELTTRTGVPVTVHLDWAYQDGERKDIIIQMTDGRSLYANMLDGFPAFKSSLFHEYRAILQDFLATIAAGGSHGEVGLDAVRLVDQTYAMARRHQIEKTLYPR